MSQIAGQVHDKFKLFSGRLEPDKTFTTLAREVEAWVREAKVAPKSIGVEYLESADRLVLTLGYRADEDPYGVHLNCVKLGTINGEGDFPRIEKAMGEASAKLQNIICHELYITRENEFLMVFMTYQK
jgi:hypothetical protein